MNVELAAPDDFIPALSGWRDRSEFIARLTGDNEGYDDDLALTR